MHQEDGFYGLLVSRLQRNCGKGFLCCRACGSKCGSLSCILDRHEDAHTDFLLVYDRLTRIHKFESPNGAAFELWIVSGARVLLETDLDEGSSQVRCDGADAWFPERRARLTICAGCGVWLGWAFGEIDVNTLANSTEVEAHIGKDQLISDMDCTPPNQTATCAVVPDANTNTPNRPLLVALAAKRSTKTGRDGHSQPHSGRKKHTSSRSAQKQSGRSHHVNQKSGIAAKLPQRLAPSRVSLSLMLKEGVMWCDRRHIWECRSDTLLEFIVELHDEQSKHQPHTSDHYQIVIAYEEPNAIEGDIGPCEVSLEPDKFTCGRLCAKWRASATGKANIHVRWCGTGMATRMFARATILQVLPHWTSADAAKSELTIPTSMAALTEHEDIGSWSFRFAVTMKDSEGRSLRCPGFKGSSSDLYIDSSRWVPSVSGGVATTIVDVDASAQDGNIWYTLSLSNANPGKPPPRAVSLSVVEQSSQRQIRRSPQLITLEVREPISANTTSGDNLLQNDLRCSSTDETAITHDTTVGVGEAELPCLPSGKTSNDDVAVQLDIFSQENALHVLNDLVLHEARDRIDNRDSGGHDSLVDLPPTPKVDAKRTDSMFVADLETPSACKASDAWSFPTPAPLQMDSLMVSPNRRNVAKQHGDASGMPNTCVYPKIASRPNSAPRAGFQRRIVVSAPPKVPRPESVQCHRTQIHSESALVEIDQPRNPPLQGTGTSTPNSACSWVQPVCKRASVNEGALSENTEFSGKSVPTRSRERGIDSKEDSAGSFLAPCTAAKSPRALPTQEALFLCTSRIHGGKNTSSEYVGRKQAAVDAKKKTFVSKFFAWREAVQLDSTFDADTRRFAFPIEVETKKTQNSVTASALSSFTRPRSRGRGYLPQSQP